MIPELERRQRAAQECREAAERLKIVQKEAAHEWNDWRLWAYARDAVATLSRMADALDRLDPQEAKEKPDGLSS